MPLIQLATFVYIQYLLTTISDFLLPHYTGLYKVPELSGNEEIFPLEEDSRIL